MEQGVDFTIEPFRPPNVDLVATKEKPLTTLKLEKNGHHSTLIAQRGFDVGFCSVITNLSDHKLIQQ
jgi:hypothetical protein